MSPSDITRLRQLEHKRMLTESEQIELLWLLERENLSFEACDELAEYAVHRFT